jgi:prevent-host-death family protein
MKKTFSVSEFKSKSLGLLEKIARSGESITITKRGKPIAKVIPFQDSQEKAVPGRLEATLLSEEDIVTPLGAKLWKAGEPK